MMKHYALLLLCCISASAQVVIPDANFKAKLLAADVTNDFAKNLEGNYFKIDANSNGEIEESEALQVSFLRLQNASIATLDGIAAFGNMYGLFCKGNQITSLDLLADLPAFTYLNCDSNQLTELDLTAHPNMIFLSCTSNEITDLNVSGLTQLEYLYCSGNPISTLDIDGFTALKYLMMNATQITHIDVSDSPNLYEFFCNSNPGIEIVGLQNLSNLNYFEANNDGLTHLDLSGMTSLTGIYASNNQITELDLSHNLNLEYLQMQDNLITTIDLSNHFHITGVTLNNNQLTSLFIKNGKNEQLGLGGNPTLEFICADESDMTLVQQIVTAYGYTNCVLNSYCSFVPGGEFYTLEGMNTYDADGNGCDASDPAFPNLRLIRNFSENNFCDETGSYSIPLQAGSHFLAPFLENPTYFNVSPAGISVNFPEMTSPQMQNFCISPNGDHNDLEVTLIPLGSARPGFDAEYKILYTNAGTTTQSGTVAFAYDDSVVDFVAAAPTTNTQSAGSLGWQFTGLKPLETRWILLRINLNSPTEMPPLNAGQMLALTASAQSAQTDETPANNAFSLHQPIVNSFDPNDKTCLDGTTVSPSAVGNYVHYLIRFENTGNATAQNIVVRDMIDTSKFDVKSLIPVDGSHNFSTRMMAPNRVEFIFENINLPFDDANNDGYVAFKVKTKPTLTVGSSFSNSASIFFDYNHPIVTDPAVTTIAVLKNPDFVLADHFAVHPNPAGERLFIQSKSNIEVDAIEIYNALGQLVLAIPNAQQVKDVDVSQLQSGNYFIRMQTAKGSSNAQFIKR